MKSLRWIRLVGLGLAVQQWAQRYCTWEEILYFSWKLRIKFLVFMRLLVQRLEKSLWLKATGWNGFPESSDLNWLACLKMCRKLRCFNRTNWFMFQYIGHLMIQQDCLSCFCAYNSKSFEQNPDTLGLQL